MRRGRAVAVAAVGIIGFALLAPAAVADSALYTPPEPQDLGGATVRLAADRMFGFAPMTVNLSGMVQMGDGDLVPMNGGQQIRVVVESPLVTVQSGVPVTSLLPDRHYESVIDGPAEPSAFRRALEIRRPGQYLFRIQVIAPDGRVLNSNEVTVRAL